MKWKLRVRDEGGITQLAWWETKQLDSEDDALEEAWEMMYGRTGQRHLKVIYIQGPNSEWIDSADIEALCKARASSRSLQLI